MLMLLKRLIRTVLLTGLFEFLRRLGWKWAASTVMIAVALLLIAGVVIAMLIGILVF